MAFIVAIPQVYADSGLFDLSHEFPNFFLPAQYRGLPRNEVPPAVIQHSRELLEAALNSIFNRLTVPIFKDGQYVSVPYFEYLHTEIHKIDPTAEIAPSGGVVRSAISFIYAELYRELEKNPAANPEEVLKQLAQATEALPAHRIRGVGSDFDTLLMRFDPLKLTALKDLATRLTNSAETAAGMTNSRHAGKRAFFTIADFKVYAEQISRSTGQGGSDVDFLAFDVIRGKMIQPPAVEDAPDYSVIWDNLICGRYRYLPPVDSIEDAAKQTVRGFRPLLELPFIQLEDEAQLRAEIKSTKLSPKAIEQFAKMVRNARFAGAHNRIYRSKEGTLDHDILNLVLSYSRARHENPLIPEFVDELPLGRASTIPTELLVPMNDFIAKHTDHGVLYHGTKDIASGLAIMRKGLFISGGANEQGTAARGRGGYSTPNIATARSFAGGQGMVFHLKVKKDFATRVLDWSTAQSHPWIQEIQRANPRRDLFEALARDHGIDIIVNGHVLVQNTRALEMNTDLDMILQSLADAIGESEYRSGLTLDRDINAVQEFAGLAAYQAALGGTAIRWPDISKMATALRTRILSGASRDPAKDFQVYNQLSSIWPETPALDKKTIVQMTERLLGQAPSVKTLSYFTMLTKLSEEDAVRLAAKALGMAGTVYARDGHSSILEVELVLGYSRLSHLDIQIARDHFNRELNRQGILPVDFLSLQENDQGRMRPVVAEFFNASDLRLLMASKLDAMIGAATDAGYRRTLIRLDFKTSYPLRRLRGDLKNIFNDLAAIEAMTNTYSRDVIDKHAQRDTSFVRDPFNGLAHDLRVQERLLSYLNDEPLMDMYPTYFLVIAELYATQVQVWAAGFESHAVEIFKELQDAKKLNLNVPWQARVWRLALKNGMELGTGEVMHILSRPMSMDESEIELFEKAARQALQSGDVHFQWDSLCRKLNSASRLTSFLNSLGANHPQYWNLAVYAYNIVRDETFKTHLINQIMAMDVLQTIHWSIIYRALLENSNGEDPKLIRWVASRSDVSEPVLNAILHSGSGNMVLQVFANRQGLQPAMITQIADNYLKTGGRGWKRLLYAQKTWSDAIAVQMMKNWVKFPYEEKVLILRKIAPNRDWSTDLFKAYAAAKLIANPSLVQWGIESHMRLVGCNDPLLGNF